MAAITATNSATLSLQASVTKSRLEQARREAAQAEDSAKALHAQAQEQDRIAEQARQRERSLSEKASTPASGVQTATENVPAPLSSAPKTAGQRDASYVETLHTVLEAPNALASSEYGLPAQRNIVISSLFQKADEVWKATPPDTRVSQLYGGRRTSPQNPAAGQLLNTQA